MSVCRCISILNPYYTIRTRTIATLLGVYLTILMVMFMYPLFVCNPVYSYQIHPLVRIGIIGIYSNTFLIILYGIITMFLPTIPTLGCCVITVVKLLRSSPAVGTQEHIRVFKVDILKINCGLAIDI